MARYKASALRLALVLLWLGAAPKAWAAPLPMPDQAQPESPALQPSTTAAPGKKKRKAIAHEQAGVEMLLLELSINDQRLSHVVRAEQMPGGPLLLPVDAWIETRLAPLAQATTLGDGTPAYALDALPGATWRLDRQNMSIEISAPAGAFVASTFMLDTKLGAPPPRSRPGVMLDYDLTVSSSAGSISSGATLEAVAFSQFGNIVSSALVTNSASGRSVTRLDTYWRYDLPHRMETLIVGDSVGIGGGWSRPARYGGIRWGCDFGMRPGFVTLPQLSLTGEAALPSTVDVLVNNTRRMSRSVQPGPFELSNVPIVSGAGEIGLVVRDLLGRETVVRQSYYASPRLLAPGLSDFSLEAGRLRTGYGSDTAYGAAFGTATWRQGLRNSLTGEARLEWQGQRRAAGVELDGLLGAWGVARVALAVSGNNMPSAHDSGRLVQAGIERSTLRGGGALQYEHAGRGFAPFGDAPGALAVAQRARDRWLASLGGSLWGAVSGGASFVRQTRWNGEQVQMLGLSLNQSLWQKVSLALAINKRLDSERSLTCAISLNLPLGAGIGASSQVSRGGNGKLTSSVSASGNAPAGPGLGWRVQAASPESQRAQLGLQYNTSAAEWALDATSSAKGQLATRVDGRGTVGWLEGMAFASRPVGQSSVAVIKVDGIKGVPVLRNYQVVAVTDARGLAFVPGLLPWQKNRIEIDALALPLDIEVSSTERDIIPFARSGMLLDFNARRSRQALLVLHQRDGTPVPIGARVRLLPAGPEFIVGRRGEVWLTELAEQRQRVHASWPKGSCTLELDVPASRDGMPGKIGPLACHEET